MIFGIGIDLIEIQRIKNVMERNETAFTHKILTETELKKMPQGDKRRAEYLAGRFAGKEAVAKAYGTGIGKELGWRDIEIDTLPTGQPIVKLRRNCLLNQAARIHISISHSDTMAIAKVIIEQM
ncbi:holo-ACP synthase [Tepidibacillus marianensis]|uniref:holo-ACP synthase n=1 Tax=Tepidibacillus marianensis TaxID=3131995 RepID=UPI0030D3CF76